MLVPVCHSIKGLVRINILPKIWSIESIFYSSRTRVFLNELKNAFIAKSWSYLKKHIQCSNCTKFGDYFTKLAPWTLKIREKVIWVIMRIFDLVRCWFSLASAYVPIYHLSKNEILMETFWGYCMAYCRTVGRTNRRMNGLECILYVMMITQHHQILVFPQFNDQDYKGWIHPRDWNKLDTCI